VRRDRSGSRAVPRADRSVLGSLRSHRATAAVGPAGRAV